MAFSSNHIIQHSKAAGSATISAVCNLCAVIKDHNLPPECLHRAEQLSIDLLAEFHAEIYKFFHVNKGILSVAHPHRRDQNEKIVERVFGEERQKIDQEIAIARFEHSAVRLSASDSMATALSASAANPIALSAVVPTGFLKLSDCYIEVVEAIYAATGKPQPSPVFDQEYADADFHLRNSISESVKEYFRRSIQAAWQHPPLSLWTRGAPGIAPETLNSDRLAATTSVAWPKTIKSGLLIVYSDPALLPFDRWPLYVAKGEWSNYRKLVLAAHVPSVPDRKPLGRGIFDAWWQKLSASEKSGTQRELTALCNAAFPDNKVPRSYIRDVTAGRKPGKRPLRTN